jgi:putative chitinase
MGNTEAGDGYKFRGRGFTQLTGKDNYAAAGKALGMDLLSNPDAAADPANAAKISAWYWKSRMSSKGAGEDVTKATKLVNGGTSASTIARRRRRSGKTRSGRAKPWR